MTWDSNVRASLNYGSFLRRCETESSTINDAFQFIAVVNHLAGGGGCRREIADAPPVSQGEMQGYEGGGGSDSHHQVFYAPPNYRFPIAASL